MNIRSRHTINGDMSILDAKKMVLSSTNPKEARTPAIISSARKSNVIVAFRLTSSTIWATFSRARIEFMKRFQAPSFLSIVLAKQTNKHCCFHSVKSWGSWMRKTPQFSLKKISKSIYNYFCSFFPSKSRSGIGLCIN